MAATIEPADLRAKFFISGPDLPEISPSEPETNTEKGALPMNKSRFKVARVEFADEPVTSSRSPEHHAAAEAEAGEDDADAAGDGAGRPAGGRPPRTVSTSGSSGGPDGTTSPPYSPNMSDSYQMSSQDTHLKTFGHNTLESLPHLDHYRNVLSATGGGMRKRPTLLELHEQDVEDEELLLQSAENGHVPVSSVPVEEVKPQTTAPKFGWIKGVLVRCLLNIYGVMLFLRLSWVVGQSGIGLSVAVILLSAVVTTITALSMSAICTNGEIKGGGAYFMISRSLGPEFGGAIGLIFSVANAVAVAMYTVGFAETIRDILREHDCLMVDEVNDVRIIGLITVFALLALAMGGGMEWESRAQLVLLAILVIAIANFVIGSFIPPSEASQARGFVGYRGQVFVDNLGPDFRDGYNFFTVFSIFFPAATGILAGANISGDLADAQRAIPKGTLMAILISTLTYIGMALISGACIVRDAFGPVTPDGSTNTSALAMYLSNSTETALSMLGNGSTLVQATSNGMAGVNGSEQYVCEVGSCKFGLQNDMTVMQLVSAYAPITVAGIISATLSSALASLVSAPKVFQAVCKDKIFPYIHIFAKGYGKNEEPWRAYFLAFGIAIAFVCIGNLNVIAPLISNFFLMSYALINYSCFDASLSNSPGWRPAFRFYSMWLSLVGAVICLAVMFIINWWTALITFACVSALYIFVHYRKPDINWGSSTQAHVYRNALQHTMKLVSVLEHVKNFRPQMLVLSAFPRDRQILVDFASNITKTISLMICGHIVQGDPYDKLKDIRVSTKAAYAWLGKRKVKSFYTAVTAQNFRAGSQALMQCAGVGKLRPNMLLVGFKSNWKNAAPREVDDYFNVIHDAFDLHFGIGILRIQGGLDFSHITNAEATPNMDVTPHVCDMSEIQGIMGKGNDSDSDPEDQEEDVFEDKVKVTHVEPEVKINVDLVDDSYIKFKASEVDKDVLKDLNRFHRKQKRGNVDVWWLFDDGGLTLLIPYILSTKKQWEHCKLRVFMAGHKKMELDRDQRHMATLLSKFRIEYSSMTVIPDIGKKPYAQHIDEFDTLIKDWMLDSEKGETEETHPWKISEDSLTAQTDKTYRHLRLHELLQQHSRDANLIVMTLPMPKKGLVSSGLYMAWVDALTKDMPPILLLRGNQESVLTYYS